jgi:hypothetical protein
MRWGVALPCGALRSRHELARAVNDAFVGDILSVGRGDDLSVVFVTADGEAEEMPAPRGAAGGARRGGGGGESASKWRRLSKQAARVYVRWHDGAGLPGGGVVELQGAGGVVEQPRLTAGAATGNAGGPPAQKALPMAQEELD